MIVFLLRHWYSVVAVLLTAGYMALLEARGDRLVTFLLGVGYVVLLGLIFFVTYRSDRHRFAIGMTVFTGVCGGIGLYSLIESYRMRLLLLLVGSLLVGAALYIPQRFRAELAHEYKPWRRMYVALITAVLFSFISMLYGFDVFFQAPPFVWYGVCGAVITSLLTLGIYRLYYPSITRQMVLYAGVMGLVGFELLWVLSYVSLGYLIIALVYTLIWYICMVLIRFHLSHKGIVWRKQYMFISLSACALALILFIARWL